MENSGGYNRSARKILHITGGLPVLALPYIPYWLALGVLATCVLVAYVLKPGNVRWLWALSKPSDRAIGVITGLRGYALTVFVLMLLWGLMELASVHLNLVLFKDGGTVRYIMFGWLALAIGDGLAGLLGPDPDEGYTVPWSRTKTWWGLAGCFLGVLLAYFISFGLSFGMSPHDSLPLLIWFGIGAAVLVALIESVETPVDDNYLVGLSAPLLALLFHLLV